MPRTPAKFRHVALSSALMGTAVASVLMLPATLRSGAWLPFIGAFGALVGWLALSMTVLGRYLAWRHHEPIVADTQSFEITTALPRARLLDLLADAMRSAGARDLRVDAGDALTIHGVTRPAFVSNGERIEVAIEPFGRETLVRVSSKPRLRMGFLDGGRSWRHVSSILQRVLDEEEQRDEPGV